MREPAPPEERGTVLPDLDPRPPVPENPGPLPSDTDPAPRLPGNPGPFPPDTHPRPPLPDNPGPFPPDTDPAPAPRQSRREPPPPEERGTAPLADGFGGGGGAAAADGGLPPVGTSEADVIGLAAVGTQFGLAALQAGHAARELATGPLLSPALLLALAMDRDEGIEAFGRMQSLAFLRGPDSLAGAALALAGDAVVLETSAIRFMLADSGFFTDPILTVPLDQGEGPDAGVVRTIRLHLGGDVTIHGVEVAAGSTVVVEYLANGRVRVTLERSGGAGAEVEADSGVSLTGSTVGSMSWLMANDREAARLVALLTATNGSVLASRAFDAATMLALSGAASPIPRPQTVSVATGAELDVSLGSDLAPAGVSPFGTGSMGELALAEQGQVTFDERGDRTYQFQLDARGSTGLSGPMLDALRPHLPGAHAHVDPDILEAGTGGALEVRTNARNEIEEVSVAFRVEAGQGSGLSSDVVPGRSTAGASSEVTLTLDREALEACGPDGQRVIRALATGNPRLAAEASEALARIVERGTIDVTDRDYVRISGGVEVQRGPEGAGLSGEVSIERTR
ncbi:MAG TPA: hypothetical protein VIL48_17800 [Acidimicrobiales bacterium]